MPEPSDLRFETLDPHAEDEESLARLTAYVDCFAQAFLAGRTTQEQRSHWLESSRADDVLLRAAYDDSSPLRRPGAPVATFSSWRGELNVGGGRTLPVSMISDVTVEPTHRRRGLLRRLMTDDLAAAAAAGVPLAALTASEATIYGRFGFGASTRVRRVRVDTGARFAMRSPVAAVRVEVLDPASAYPSVRAVDQAVLTRVRGAVARPASYRPEDEGRFSWESKEPDRRTRVAVAVDVSGRPTGYARFVPTQSEEPELGGTAQVSRLEAVDDTSYLVLWDFLAHLDLIHTVAAEVRVEDLLEVALADHRVVRTQSTTDLLWLRVLDTPRTLVARPWRDDGDAVVAVDDPLGHAAGHFHLAVRDHRAEVRRTEAQADVRLDAATLATLYLGDRTVTQLAAAGQVTGPKVTTFASMADHAGPAPWCTTDF